MYKPTEIVKHLLIINVLVYVAAYIFFPSWNQAIIKLGLFHPSNEAGLFKPHQLLTHMFMHGGTGHLFFNMLALYFIGPWVERKIGPRDFLSLYLFSGLGSMLLHLGILTFGGGPYGVPVVGASGAIMGVLVAFAFYFPNAKLMLIFPPIPVKAKVLVPILIGIDVIGGVSPIDSPIAHFAHIGGALFGFLLLIYWKQKSRV